MSEPTKKTINVQSSVVIKKSQDFKQVAHKATAGLSEADAIERFTIGNIEDDGQEKDNPET